MSALITQAQWEAAVGAATVAALTGSDATVIAARLAEASDWLAEYATAAGVELTSGTITAAMAYRCAIRATYTAAQLQQQFRGQTGEVPFTKLHDQARAELEAWARRIRPKSDDTLSTAPEVLSDDARGW